MSSNDNPLPLLYENKNVYQANELVRAFQEDVTLLEAKILRLIMLQVVRNDTDFRTYTCRVVDLANFLGFARQNLYKEVQSMASSLMKKTITIQLPGKNKKGEPNYKKINWLSSFEYQDGIVTFRLSDELRPYLLQLTNYTVCEIDEIRALPSLYALRLYELIKSYVNTLVQEESFWFSDDVEICNHEIIFSVSFLRKYFSCENIYPRASSFVKRVIESSVNYINKNTVLPLGFRTITTCREISRVSFFLVYELLSPEEIIKKIST